MAPNSGTNNNNITIQNNSTFIGNNSTNNTNVTLYGNYIEPPNSVLIVNDDKFN